VLEIPTSGCPEGHTYCRDCLAKALKKARKCPACRHPVSDSQLRRNRPLEGVINRLRVNCKHASPSQFSDERRGDGGVALPPPAKRARLTPAAELTAEELATALCEHGLEATGEQDALAARLQNHRDAASCTWTGTVGELGAHLQLACPWQPVVCTNAGCGQTWARRKMVDHVRSPPPPPLSLSHTHTHTHYHLPSLSVSLSLSLTHTHTHTPRCGARASSGASRASSAPRPASSVPFEPRRMFLVAVSMFRVAVGSLLSRVCSVLQCLGVRGQACCDHDPL